MKRKTSKKENNRNKTQETTAIPFPFLQIKKNPNQIKLKQKPKLSHQDNSVGPKFNSQDPCSVRE